MDHDSWFVSVLGAREERSGNMRGGMKGREEEDEGENVNDTDARRRGAYISRSEVNFFNILTPFPSSNMFCFPQI